MARTSDREARRAQLARAVESLVRSGGLDAVTVARVAAEAGVSVGLVQHYFADKDDLLLFAYRSVLHRTEARVADRIAEGGAHRRPIRAIVHDSLRELLPLDDTRRGEYQVVQAFLGRCLDNPALGRVAAATAADLRARIGRAVANGRECGEVPADTDADRAALRVTALTDGLALRLHQEPTTPVGPAPMRDACDDALRACLAEVFSGTCRQYG